MFRIFFQFPFFGESAAQDSVIMYSARRTSQSDRIKPSIEDYLLMSTEDMDHTNSSVSTNDKDASNLKTNFQLMSIAFACNISWYLSSFIVGNIQFNIFIV
jgi:hypothetical protein